MASGVNSELILEQVITLEEATPTSNSAQCRANNPTVHLTQEGFSVTDGGSVGTKLD